MEYRLTNSLHRSPPGSGLEQATTYGSAPDVAAEHTLHGILPARFRSDLLHNRDGNGGLGGRATDGALALTRPAEPAFEGVAPRLVVESGGSRTMTVTTPLRAKIVTADGEQVVRLPDGLRFEGQQEVLIYREGRRVVLEPERRRWSRRFLDLAGSAPDFPYPDEPPPAEPGPDLD